MSKTIGTPYDPEDHVNEFGWIWGGDLEDWLLCYTTETDDGELVVGVYSLTIGYTDTHDEWSADRFRGAPYIPLSAPACTPGAGLLVTAHLPGGGTMAVSREDTGPEAEADWERIRAAMLGDKA